MATYRIDEQAGPVTTTPTEREALNVARKRSADTSDLATVTRIRRFGKDRVVAIYYRGRLTPRVANRSNIA